MINKKEIPLTLFMFMFVIAVSLIGMVNPSVAIIITVLLLAFIFFIISKKDYFPAISIIGITFCTSYNMITEGAVLLFLLLAVYAFLFLIKKEYRIKNYWSSYTVFFIFWLIFATLQMLWAVHTDKSFNHYQSLFVGVLLILFLGQLINSKERLEMLINSWGVFYLSVIIFALWEINTGNHIGGRFGDQIRPGVATGGFYNQNNLSFYLAISLPVAFYWTTKKWFLKILGLFMILMTFYVLYSNSTRSILALFVAITFIYLMKLVFDKRRKLFLLLTTVVTLFAVTQWQMIYDALISVITVNDDGGSVSYRVSLINHGLDVFARNPIFGVGPGNIENYMAIPGANVHHFWVEIIANYGIIIFMGLFFFFLSCILTFLKYKSGGSLKNIAWTVMLSALMFIPAANTPSSSFQIIGTWFLFAVMICTVNVIVSEKKKANDVLNKSAA